MLDKLRENPKQLFLLDGFGAILSAFLLGVVLVQLESTFGMPREVLYPLALAACGFAIYDFICYFRITKNWKPFLIGIAIINLIYCIISIGLMIQHYPQLTTLGVLYFCGEIVILFVLIGIELKVASK